MTIEKFELSEEEKTRYISVYKVGAPTLPFAAMVAVHTDRRVAFWIVEKKENMLMMVENSHKVYLPEEWRELAIVVGTTLKEIGYELPK